MSQPKQLAVPLNRYPASIAGLFQQPPPDRPSSLPVRNPTKSFWLDSEHNPLAKEGSTGPLSDDEVDIVVIGSGITGMGALWTLVKGLTELKGEKIKIMVLEARDFCSGATGRNGGHLSAIPFHGFTDRQRARGTTEAVKSFEFEHRTANAILEFIEEQGIAEEIDLVEGGHNTLLFSPEEEKLVRDDYDAALKAGMDLEHVWKVEWIAKEIAEERYGTPYTAVRAKAHNLWPAKLVTALFNASKKLASASGSIGISLHTSAPVTSTSVSSGSFTTVVTPRGSVKAKYVLHATNAYAAYLLPHLYGPNGIIPTRGQVLAIRHSLGGGSEKDGEKRKVSWDGNEGLEYWFPRPTRSEDDKAKDPLIILGGGRENAKGFEVHVSDDSTVDEDVGSALRKFLGSLYIGGEETGKVEREWSGIMGYTRDGDPFVGPLSQNGGKQYIAAGYTGHGMPRAFSCGEIVSSMILADMQGKPWEAPSWFPQSYLTWNKPRSS